MKTVEHEKYMHLALEEAQKAYDKKEVPIGAVLVQEGKVIARTHNMRETLHDSTAHAEILALRQGGEKLNNWRLNDCTLYVTIEPCAMCAGALTQTRLPLLVFGARDAKAGATGSLYNLVQDDRLNHRLEIIEGILEEDCAAIMKDFFRSRRKKKPPITTD